MNAKREDIKTILIVGSGPIVIGQACEFDYSGTQACKGPGEWLQSCFSQFQSCHYNDRS